MEKYCPIISETVDTHLIKANAAFVLVTLVFSLFYNWLILIVALDFAIRVFFGVKNSPLCMVIRKSLNAMNVKQHKVNAGPKKLASKFGFAFSLIIIALNILNLPIAAIAVTTIFITLTALEVFFSFCVVCLVYPYLNKIGLS